MPAYKREKYIQYILQTFNDAGKDWRTKQLLAKNLGNYVTLFDLKIVYKEFLPMFFKFCEDRVNTVNSAAATALAPILIKFKNDTQQMRAIIKIVKNNFRYGDVATFKRRQLYVIMCEHVMNQAPDIFQEYFMNDFLSLVQDRVPNVRIGVARTLRSHFKTINGAFVSDTLVNHAIRVLKNDKDNEVVSICAEIQSL